MRTTLVTRHPGAVEWARRRGIRFDECLPHLEIGKVQRGDTLVGTLPVPLAAEVCARGARYIHLTLDLPEHLRGHELTADDLERLGARLRAFDVRAL